MRKLSKFLRSILTIIVIFTVNAYIGGLMTVIIIINFFILNHMNTIISDLRRQKVNKKGEIFEKFVDIVENRNLINKLGAKKKVKINYNI